METKSHVFTYRTLRGNRIVADCTVAPHEFNYWKQHADFVLINPAMTPVTISVPLITPVMHYSFNSFNVPVFCPNQEQWVRKYLATRGWWCGKWIPLNPSEIADIERACFNYQEEKKKKAPEPVKEIKKEYDPCEYNEYLLPY